MKYRGYISKGEIVETKFVVDQGVIETGGLLKELTAFLVHVVISQVQTEQGFVFVQALFKRLNFI